MLPRQSGQVQSRVRPITNNTSHKHTCTLSSACARVEIRETRSGPLSPILSPSLLLPPQQDLNCGEERSHQRRTRSDIAAAVLATAEAARLRARTFAARNLPPKVPRASQGRKRPRTSERADETERAITGFTPTPPPPQRCFIGTPQIGEILPPPPVGSLRVCSLARLRCRARRRRSLIGRSCLPSNPLK